MVNNVSVTNSNSGPLGASSGNVSLPPTSLRNVDQNIRTAQTQFWSAALEQPARGEYAGFSPVPAEARGIHLYDIKNYNGLGGGNATLGDPVQDPAGRIDPTTGKPYQALTRLNPQYSNINNRGSGGDSKYEAMNVQFETTDLHHTGLSIIANYTIAHETDDLSSTFSESAANNSFGLGYTDPFNPSLDYGSGDLDIRHRWCSPPSTPTPSFRSSVPHRALLNEVFAKWQISGIYTVRSGSPFTYYDTTTNYSGYSVPRYTPLGGPVPQHTFKSIPKGVTSSNNTYVIGQLPLAYSFANPAYSTVDPSGHPFGISDWGPYPSNMSTRNSFRGPGAWNVDASLSKTFPIHKQISVELRADAIDLFNHHNLYLQEGLFDVANYNIIDGNPTQIGTVNPKIIASKGGIGSSNGSNGANDERRYGQFSAKINF